MSEGMLAFVCVMSMTCHFMRGLFLRFLSIISLMTPFEKSMLVMPVQPSSYLHIEVLGLDLNY